MLRLSKIDTMYLLKQWLFYLKQFLPTMFKVVVAVIVAVVFVVVVAVVVAVHEKTRDTKIQGHRKGQSCCRFEF